MSGLISTFWRPHFQRLPLTRASCGSVKSIARAYQVFAVLRLGVRDRQHDRDFHLFAGDIEDVWAAHVLDPEQRRLEVEAAQFALPAVDLHSNLRLGPIWVKSGTEIETGASFSLNLSANFAALSGESGLLFDCGLPGFDDGV